MRHKAQVSPGQPSLVIQLTLDAFFNLPHMTLRGKVKSYNAGNMNLKMVICQYQEAT